ncbi:hypothetical protein GGH99_008489 [Coemansia sp. RSA 1285]|nr:hypothetical protein GGH99_008489 [Coemansia sp. RSA 1285]
MSAARMAASMSVVKRRLAPRTLRTISSSPGSYTGRLDEFHAAMRLASVSTTVNSMSLHFKAITALVGPPTYPAPMQHTCVTAFSVVCAMYTIEWEAGCRP